MSQRIDMAQGKKTHTENRMVGCRQDLRDSGLRPWAQTRAKRGKRRRYGSLSYLDISMKDTDILVLFVLSIFPLKTLF